MTTIRNKSSVFTGTFSLGCFLCSSKGIHMNMFVEERLKPLKFSPQAHQGLVDNFQAICIPYSYRTKPQMWFLHLSITLLVPQTILQEYIMFWGLSHIYKFRNWKKLWWWGRGFLLGGWGEEWEARNQVSP